MLSATDRATQARGVAAIAASLTPDVLARLRDLFSTTKRPDVCEHVTEVFVRLGVWGVAPMLEWIPLPLGGVPEWYKRVAFDRALRRVGPDAIQVLYADSVRTGRDWSSAIVNLSRTYRLRPIPMPDKRFAPHEIERIPGLLHLRECWMSAAERIASAKRGLESPDPTARQEGYGTLINLVLPDDWVRPEVPVSAEERAEIRELLRKRVWNEPFMPSFMFVVCLAWLGWLGPEELAEVRRIALDHSHKQCQTALYEYVECHPDPRAAVNLLAELVAQRVRPDEVIMAFRRRRTVPAEAIADEHVPAFVQLLFETPPSRSPEVLEDDFEHVASLLGRRAVPFIMERLRGPDPLVRQTAAEYLGAIGPDAAEALPLLRAQQERWPAQTGSACAKAIAKIERREQAVVDQPRAPAPSPAREAKTCVGSGLLTAGLRNPLPLDVPVTEPDRFRTLAHLTRFGEGEELPAVALLYVGRTRPVTPQVVELISEYLEWGRGHMTHSALAAALDLGEAALPLADRVLEVARWCVVGTTYRTVEKALADTGTRSVSPERAAWYAAALELVAERDRRRAGERGST